jgi:hypothetical protein
MPIIGSFGAGSGRGFGFSSGGVFICATGGTITESGDYRIHTFTGPGTFCVSAGDGSVDYLVVAGGGLLVKMMVIVQGVEVLVDIENHIQLQFQAVTQQVL